MKYIRDKRSEHTYKAVSCASVVDMYSSCAVFNDTSVRSLLVVRVSQVEKRTGRIGGDGKWR